MSKLVANLNDGTKELVVVLSNTSTDQALALLVNEATKPVNKETTVVDFLNRTGTIISIETPNSSWVDRVEFNAQLGEISFIADNDSRQSFSASFNDFQDVLKAPSSGKIFWEFKRGDR